jgi:glycerol-3-phosphate dehydrogenase subunit C
MSIEDKVISYRPTEGLSYDPEEPRFWDKALLDKEVERIFEVCHGCRMCFKYCDAFPELFEFIDKQHGGDVRQLAPPEIDTVFDACFQCKLCEVQCPYTPRDNHPYQIDFPKLVHRYQAVRAKSHGVSLRDRFLGDPDKAARLARASFGLANVANRLKPSRWAMEKVLGIHRRKDLPSFASTTFDTWAERQGLVRKEPKAEVVLFQTCFVQHNEPALGKDVVDVYRKSGIDVACVPGLRCCGMPAWEHGDLDTLRENARHNLDLLLPFVEAGALVAVINPTCSMMMRREYAHLLEGKDRERAERLAQAVRDTGELLWALRNEPRFAADFKSTPGKVAYHAPCHLRAQAIGFKGRDMLRRIPGVDVRTVMECSGHNGTYAMKREGFEVAARIGQKAFDGLKQAESEVWATECPLAALQIAQHTGRKPLHPMTILARAYRKDGFPSRVPETPAAALQGE